MGSSSAQNGSKEVPLASTFQRLHIGTPGSLAYRVLFVSPQNSLLSPWHDIPLCSKGGFSLVCTTPAGSWLRFQVAQDEPSDPLRVDRVAAAAMTRSLSNPFRGSFLRPAQSGQNSPGPPRQRATRVKSSETVYLTDDPSEEGEPAGSPIPATSCNISYRVAHFTEDTSWHLGFFPQTSLPVFQGNQDSSRKSSVSSSTKPQQGTSQLEGDTCPSFPGSRKGASDGSTSDAAVEGPERDRPTGGRRQNDVTFATLDLVSQAQNPHEATDVRPNTTDAKAAVASATRRGSVVVPSDSTLPKGMPPLKVSAADIQANDPNQDSPSSERPIALKVRSKRNRPLEAMEIGCQKGRLPGEVYEVRPLAVISRIHKNADGEGEALAVVVVATDNPLAEVLDDGEDVEGVFPGMLTRMRDWLERQQPILGFEETAGVPSTILIDTSLHSTTSRVSRSHLVWQGQYEHAMLHTEPVVLPSLEENLLTALWDTYTHGSSSYLAHVAIPLSNPLRSSSSDFSVSDDEPGVPPSSTKQGKVGGPAEAKHGGPAMATPALAPSARSSDSTTTPSPVLPPRRSRFGISSSLFSWKNGNKNATKPVKMSHGKEGGKSRRSKTEASSPREVGSPLQFKQSMVPFSESIVQQPGGLESVRRSSGKEGKAVAKKKFPKVDSSYVPLSEGMLFDRSSWLQPPEEGRGGREEAVGFDLGDAGARRLAKLRFLDIG